MKQTIKKGNNCCFLPDFCYDNDMSETRKEIIRFNMLSVITVPDEDTPAAFPAHWHNAAEFVVAKKDGCKYRINDDIHTLASGDVLLIWPHQIHEIVSVPPSTVRSPVVLR